ncbi:MAG: DUF192 domain-containing protein [Rhodobacteraceae bacterium]|nr:DUF192 domain-containing protein [Paracoccaceae bacterium]
MCAAAIACLWAGPVFAGCAQDIVDFRWPGGHAHFSVALADDSAERARGLMFRDTLASGSGMLFVYDHPQTVAFWMKNTPLPLDMLFIGADGRVERVAAKAVPFDETPIPGGDDIQFVLEINGGLAARLGLGEGAEMRHPAIDSAVAAWPCAAP